MDTEEDDETDEDNYDDSDIKKPDNRQGEQSKLEKLNAPPERLISAETKPNDQKNEAEDFFGIDDNSLED